MARNRQLVEMIDARASDPGIWVPLIKYTLGLIPHLETFVTERSIQMD